MRYAFLLAAAVVSTIQALGTNGGEPQGVPTLEPPITLDELHVWRDGGSLGFKLSDAKHHQLAFCIDGRAGSSTRGYFFLNVTHANQNGGQKLDLGAPRKRPSSPTWNPGSRLASQRSSGPPSFRQ